MKRVYSMMIDEVSEQLDKLQFMQTHVTHLVARQRTLSSDFRNGLATVTVRSVPAVAAAALLNLSRCGDAAWTRVKQQPSH
jgi:hypothetical protein